MIFFIKVLSFFNLLIAKIKENYKMSTNDKNIILKIKKKIDF